MLKVQSHYEQILLLKRVSFFESLRTDQLHRIVSIMEPVGWVSGETVFELGEPAEHMYLLISGQVGISLHGDPGKLIVELGQGDFFGEMGILDDLPRSAAAYALQNSEALALGKEKLRGLLLSYPELSIGMMKSLSKRMRNINTNLIDHANQTHSGPEKRRD